MHYRSGNFGAIAARRNSSGSYDDAVKIRFADANETDMREAGYVQQYDGILRRNSGAYYVSRCATGELSRTDRYPTPYRAG
jgi:hypothetical protein